MSDRTPQQIADQLNSLRAQAVTIVEGTIASAANPGGSITFTYINPIDGQPYTATGTAWNQCVPSKVSALKQTDGTWIVVGQHEAAAVHTVVHTDRRARPKEKTYGKIKVLYSVIEGDQRVFYVGGDRARPKKIHAIPVGAYVSTAILNNAGDGDRYFASLSYGDGSGFNIQKVTISSIKEWQVTPSGVNPTGHGFWTQTLGGSRNGGLYSYSYAQVSRSQFLGDAREITGGQVSFDGVDKSYPRVESDSSYNAISPTIDKLTKRYYYYDNSGGGSDYIRAQYIIRDETRRALLLGKNAASAIYQFIDSKYDEVSYLGFIFGQEKPSTVITQSFTNDAILVDCVTQQEIKLGGDLPKNVSDPTIVEFRVSDNLVDSRYFRVQLDSAIFRNSMSLDVDAYSLSAASTKTTLRKKAYSLPSPDTGMPISEIDLAALTERLRNNLPATVGNITVYSASYHP